MRAYFILVFVFWWWPLLLLTFVPAIVAGAVCGWRMRGLDWKRGVLAGLVGGFVGLGCSIAWYAVGIPGMGFMFWLYCNLVLPVPSAAGAWMTCRLWSRSRLRRGQGPPGFQRGRLGLRGGQRGPGGGLRSERPR